MALPKFLRRRRAAEGPFATDREAVSSGGDGLGSAFNWMEHVLDRDFEGAPVTRCIIVAEIGEGQESRTVYTTHSVDSTSVEIRGLLSEGLRAHEVLIAREVRRFDIEQFAGYMAPQVGELVEKIVYEKAESLVQGLAKAMEDEHRLEGAGRALLLGELRDKSITPETLRQIAPDGQYPGLGAALADLADRLEGVFEEGKA